jgi:hypothetical protein
MTHAGEERIPFHFHVLPSAVQSSSFSLFNKLPAELQLRILGLCSAPSLFQLMRVSSALRIEGAKLFWADPYTYYLINSHWLVEGGHAGNTHYDLSFLAYVQNVEVEYLSGADVKIGLILENGIEIQQNVILDFWVTLVKRVPRVRRVIFNQNWESRSHKRQNNPVSPCLQILMESCPAGIDVSAFVLERNHPVENSTVSLPTIKWQRSFYRTTPEGEWRKVTPLFSRKTILIPVKRFCGPVGEFEKCQYLRDRLALQCMALGPLSVEALDRHHFDERRRDSFACLDSNCDAYFDKPGQWSMHAMDKHILDLPKKIRVNFLPTKLRELFEIHERDLKRKDRELVVDLSRIAKRWNEEGEEKRKDMESEWIDQLENDEAWDTGSSAKESWLWKYFLMVMNSSCGRVDMYDEIPS